MDILTTIAMLIIFPFGATIVGAMFLWMFYKLKVKTCAFTGVLWILYSVYEYLMYARILCTGECNIRIDLLMIYPLLLFLSVLSIVLFFVKKKNMK